MTELEYKFTVYRSVNFSVSFCKVPANISLFSMKLLVFAITTNLEPLSFAGQCLLPKVSPEEPWRQKKERLNNLLCHPHYEVKSIQKNNSGAIHVKYSWFYILCLLHLCGWGDPWCFPLHLVRYQIKSMNYIVWHEPRIQCKMDHKHFTIIARSAQYYLVLTNRLNQNQNCPGHILIPPSL